MCVNKPAVGGVQIRDITLRAQGIFGSLEIAWQYDGDRGYAKL